MGPQQVLPPPSQSGLGINGIERVLYSPQSSRTVASLSDVILPVHVFVHTRVCMVYTRIVYASCAWVFKYKRRDVFLSKLSQRCVYECGCESHEDQGGCIQLCDKSLKNSLEMNEAFLRYNIHGTICLSVPLFATLRLPYWIAYSYHDMTDDRVPIVSANWTWQEIRQPMQPPGSQLRNSVEPAYKLLVQHGKGEYANGAPPSGCW